MKHKTLVCQSHDGALESLVLSAEGSNSVSSVLIILHADRSAVVKRRSEYCLKALAFRLYK
jgi:hypothetical protein